jgi:hypothetical protein
MRFPTETPTSVATSRSSSPSVAFLRIQSATMMTTTPRRSRQRHHGREERANASAGRSGFTLPQAQGDGDRERVRA